MLSITQLQQLELILLQKKILYNKQNCNMQKFTTASLAINGTLRKINSTNRWVVQEPFVWYIDYYDHSKWEVVIPAGYGTDFWTIPRPFQIFFNPTAHLSYVLHDYLYEHKTFSREECDLILAESLHAEWMPKIWILFVWLSVRAFGWLYY